FRGILLRWQLSRSLDGQLAVGAAALGVSILYGMGEAGSYHLDPALFTLAMLPGYALIPYLAPRPRRHEPRPGAGTGAPDRPGELDGERAAEEVPVWQDRVRTGLIRFIQRATDRRVNALLAMYGNGLLFAAFHARAWPSPIPLFLLGVG